MKHKGTKTIKTERLILRKVRIKDYKDIYKYACKDEVTKYVTWETHQNPKTTKKLCRHWKNQYIRKSVYRWAIEFGGRVIGCIDIVLSVDKTGVLGWVIDSEFWNKGIVTEAATAVKNYLLYEVGFETLEAAYVKENIGSGRVMQKIGMTQIPYKETAYFRIGKNLDENQIAFYRINK